MIQFIHPIYITIYIRYIFNTKQQHKGILWSVISVILNWQDGSEERLEEEKWVALSQPIVICVFGNM